MKKVLVLGGSGVLGTQIRHNLKQNIIDCSYKSKSKYRFDIFKKNSLNHVISKTKPDVLINCIVNRNVEKCNVNFFNGYKLNTLTCKIIYQAIKNTKIHLIHISTDQVYDNFFKKKKKFSFVKPKNFYGLTKMIGEEFIEMHPKSTIIRTNFFNDKLSKKKSFSEWIVHNLKKNKKIKLADNILFNPIKTSNLIKIINLIIIKKIYGIFDIGSKKIYSKYEFGKIIAKKNNCSVSLIKKFQNNPEKTLRSNNTILNIYKIKRKIKGNSILLND